MMPGLWSVDKDPDSDGNGQLEANTGDSSPDTVRINNKYVIVGVTDAEPDNQSKSLTDLHHNPQSQGTFPTVRAYGKPVHCDSDTRVCGATTNVVGQSTVFVGGAGAGTSLVNGNNVYTDAPKGIQAEAAAMSRVDPKMVTEPETNDPGLPVPGNPPPPAVPPNGCISSKYFNLSNAVHQIEAQEGYTKAQIECNWIALCSNVLDRLKDAGFNFNINSGFRSLAFNNSLGNSSKTSDHLIGCAADLSMGSQAQNIVLFKYIVSNIDNLGCSQVIFEHNWVHVAYKGRGPKGALRTSWTYTGSAPYGAGGANGQNLPPALHP